MILLMLVDVHCHLEREEFTNDLEDILKRARKVGIVAIVTSSLDFEEVKVSEKLVEKYPGFIYRSVCLNYTILDENLVEKMVRYIERNKKSIIAIGEVGLDYMVFANPDERSKQEKIFRYWINIAKELDLPLIVHSRSAGKYALRILWEERADRVIMHAYDGKVGYAMEASKKGYYFSIPPSIARSQQKQKLVKRLPLEALLLESDAPVLGPEKGKRNEPRNIVISLEWISMLKGIDIQRVAWKTTENAIELFGVDFTL